MTDDSKWTLWIYAGPGAELTADDLDHIRGKAPREVDIFAQFVTAPTWLQRLTGEWPTLRISPGESRPCLFTEPDRSLLRFIAWVNSRSRAGSKRALVILGDLLEAIGENPKHAVSGTYRPPYPNKITAKKGGNPTNWTHTSSNDYVDDTGTHDSFANIKLDADRDNESVIEYTTTSPGGTYPTTYHGNGDSKYWSTGTAGPDWWTIAEQSGQSGVDITSISPPSFAYHSR
ncbi:MAG: hypothetical protein KC431_03335, partial [Myxococcales bacterium]|nr:hypothetical protein [Myxococcales bacterium]